MNEMRWIVASSLRYRYLVLFVAAVLVIFGIGQIRNMPVDVFPEFAPPRVEIQTPSLGLSSEEVESLVTIPLEQVFNGLPGLDIMRSKSVEQLSSIILIFEPGTDLMEARQLVAERLAIVTPTLPTWAAPPMMMPPLSSTARTVKIGISSDTLSVIDLSMITYWKIRERLLGVPGVANHWPRILHNFTDICQLQHITIWGEFVTDCHLGKLVRPLDGLDMLDGDPLIGGLEKPSGANCRTAGILNHPRIQRV
jgi:Cu/Ag efflux pump CusA